MQPKYRFTRDWHCFRLIDTPILVIVTPSKATLLTLFCKLSLNWRFVYSTFQVINKYKVFNLHTDQVSQDQSLLGAPLSQMGQQLWMALWLLSVPR